MKLEKTSGLSDADPIHRWLKVVDNILQHEHRWSEVHQRCTKEKLIELMWYVLGHPVIYPKVEKEHVENFRDWLIVVGEPILANLVAELLKTDIDAHGIRCTMMYIICNIEYLKEREARYRSIDSGWLDE